MTQWQGNEASSGHCINSGHHITVLTVNNRDTLTICIKCGMTLEEIREGNLIGKLTKRRA